MPACAQAGTQYAFAVYAWERVSKASSSEGLFLEVICENLERRHAP